MRRIEFSPERATPILQFDSVGAAAVDLGRGAGEGHVWCLHFEPGGRIGPHPTEFAQWFLVVAGSGWAAGADGGRVALRAGQGVVFERGELHSKGSEEGMTAVMVQMSERDSAADGR